MILLHHQRGVRVVGLVGHARTILINSSASMLVMFGMDQEPIVVLCYVDHMQVVVQAGVCSGVLVLIVLDLMDHISGVLILC